MNDTPETNEAQFGTGRVSVDFARRMERERNEARIVANGMRWLLPDSSPVVEFPWEVTE